MTRFMQTRNNLLHALVVFTVIILMFVLKTDLNIIRKATTRDDNLDHIMMEVIRLALSIHGYKIPVLFVWIAYLFTFRWGIIGVETIVTRSKLSESELRDALSKTTKITSIESGSIFRVNKPYRSPFDEIGGQEVYNNLKKQPPESLSDQDVLVINFVKEYSKDGGKHYVSFGAEFINDTIERQRKYSLNPKSFQRLTTDIGSNDVTGKINPVDYKESIYVTSFDCKYCNFDIKLSPDDFKYSPMNVYVQKVKLEHAMLMEGHPLYTPYLKNIWAINNGTEITTPTPVYIYPIKILPTIDPVKNMDLSFNLFSNLGAIPSILNQLRSQFSKIINNLTYDVTTQIGLLMGLIVLPQIMIVAEPLLRDGIKINLIESNNILLKILGFIGALGLQIMSSCLDPMVLSYILLGISPKNPLVMYTGFLRFNSRNVQMLDFGVNFMIQLLSNSYIASNPVMILIPIVTESFQEKLLFQSFHRTFLIIKIVLLAGVFCYLYTFDVDPNGDQFLSFNLNLEEYLDHVGHLVNFFCLILFICGPVLIQIICRQKYVDLILKQLVILAQLLGFKWPL